MKPLVILHVEDDPNDVFFVRRAFAKASPEVTLFNAVDGEEARAFLEGRAPFEARAGHPPPALVLMDLKLPRMNGHEVLEWMRAQPALATVPVVILSSSSEKTDMERAYGLGANAYLTKQGDLNELVDIVRGIAVYATTAQEE
jgi:CheY-like chemotaxis protein